MSVYLIAAIDIEDRESYAKYEQAAFPTLGPGAAEPLFVDDAPTLIEGTLPGKRRVGLRFADEAALNRWYHGDGYQTAMKHRLNASKTAFLLVAHGFPES